MIRWVTEALGTAPAGDPSITKELVVLDVRDLVDKAGNSAKTMREKIERGAACLQEGHRLVICCDYGISRSNAIAAGILSLFRGISLNEATQAVIKATGEQEIKLDPLRSVRAALADEHLIQPEEGPRVLVTGGSGFIGRILVTELKKRHFVIAPSRQDVDLNAGAVSLDLLVKEHSINCIVHLANPRVYTSARATGDALTLLCNVLEVCKENNLHLVYPSGWEVYSGYRSDRLVAGEELPLLPKGPYGEAKCLCESLIEHHRKLHHLMCTVLRSAPLYGESGDRPKFILNFIDKAIRNEPIVTHSYLNGDPHLDLLHVDDFVSVAMAIIESRFDGVLNVGAGRAVSTRDVAEWIVRETGSRSSVASRDIEDYASNIIMDASRAQEVLSWHPMITWEAGLKRILERAVSQTPRGVGDE